MNLISPLSDIASREGRRAKDTFEAFMALTATAIRRNEARYAELAKGWSTQSLAEFGLCFKGLSDAMEVQPFTDLLGPLYMELSKEKGDRGEFYTPPVVAHFMTRANLLTLPDERPIKILEPSCGSGALVLAAAQFLCNVRGIPPSALFVDAWDLNPTACDMAFVNFTLWSIPARVVCGNALTKQVHGAWATLHVREVPCELSGGVTHG